MKNEDRLKMFQQELEDFLTNTQEARELSQRDRDYYDHKQWTDAERAKLLSRNQAPIQVNRIKPKVEGMKGLLISRKTDPKAFPRTPKHEKSAEVVTDALRYVADNVNFDQVKLDVAEDIFIEGYGAGIVDIQTRGREPEVGVTKIPWDRFYYDTHSRRKDFKDARFMGIVIWMSPEEVWETFERRVNADDIALYESGDETFDDRPRWYIKKEDRKEDRVRICQHFYIEKGVWRMCFFTAGQFLFPPIDSPFLDEFDAPMNPIEAYSAYVDRDNNRFGEVRYWIDQQDEINHRRSKFLHQNSTRQTASKRGVIPDIPAMKRELSKPDGHVEYDGEKGDFEVLSTNDMSEAQFALYQDGKHEMDAVGFNAQLSGERQGDLSGRAITTLQNAAVNELSSIYTGLAGWEKRIYTQIWFRIKQSWTKEKWIRVLDSQDKLKWVGFNTPVTLQEQFQEYIADESNDRLSRQRAAQTLQVMMASKDPRLGQIVATQHPIGELDMDIIVDMSTDSINVQSEQFELLAKIAQTRPEIPFEEIIQLSALRTDLKEKVIKNIQSRAQGASQNALQQQELTNAETRAKTKEKEAKAYKTMQEAIQTTVQTKQILENPPEDSSVVL